MDEKILLGYLDYYLSNAKIYDENYIDNEYEKYSEKIGIDDPLKDYKFGLKNLLLVQNFIKEVEPNVYFLSEKGIEAKLAGGYYKYMNQKNKLNNYQKIALIFSFVALIFSGYSSFIKKDSQVSVLKSELDVLTLKYDSLNCKVQIVESRLLYSFDKDSLPSK